MRSAIIPVCTTLLGVFIAACQPAPQNNSEPVSEPSASSSTATDVPELVAADGSYPVVPLEKDSVVIKIVQSGAVNLQQAETIQAGLDANLETMVAYAEEACSTGKKPDFLLYNEFPLTGFSYGSREEKLKFTIEIPGPETAALGEVARACDTYIIFGSYATDPEWPGHILSLNTVIGRDGEVLKKIWKVRNIKRRFTPDKEIPTTTIESVYDRFVERYGIEEVFPVLQTEYGNIAVSTVQLDPMVFAAFAMRGTEIMFRTSTLFSPQDVRATAFFNNYYSAMSNITFPEDSPAAFMGGSSLIVGPDSRILAQLEGNVNGIVEAEVPIAEFRKGRTITRFPMDVVAPVFDQYQQEIPLNHLDLPAAELPESDQAMKAYLDKISRWLNQ